MMIQATIIIPTRNRARWLARAIASFVRQDFARDGYEILVVDNGSTDNTVEVVAKAGAEYPCLKIRSVFEPVPGLLSGRHRGALEAQGDLLCFVDDDIEATPTWLSTVVGTFAGEAVHLVGGPSVPSFEISPPAWMDRFIDDRNDRINCGDLSLFDIGDRTQRIDPTYVWGLNFSIRKQTLTELGGFHPDCIPKELQHFQGDGETGLALKIRKMGLATVYAAGARVIHHIPRQRLTVSYFETRYFYQGVCDSYTRIREARCVCAATDCPSVEPPSIASNGAPYDRYRRIIYGRIQAAYAAGFRFHQEAVRADRRLLDWVLRDDYFDYRLPDLTAEVDTGAGDKGEKFEDRLTADQVVAGQLESFRQSPPEQRQSFVERSQKPLENLAVFALIKNRLIAAGVPVVEIDIDRADFELWRRQFPALTSYYRTSGDVFIEKCLEHYLVQKYLGLTRDDVYIDVAAAGSPWAEILNGRGVRAFRLDQSYSAGVDGINIGADAGDSGLPKGFCTAMSLQCAFECLMGDADVRFVMEAARVLKDKGRFAVAPPFTWRRNMLTPPAPIAISVE